MYRPLGCARELREGEASGVDATAGASVGDADALVGLA